MSYSAAAKQYRDILVDLYGLELNDDTNTPVLDMEVIGSYSYTENFIGIPYTAKGTLTTFDQLGEMIAEFKELGIENKYLSEEDIKNETSSLNKPFTMLFIGVDSSKDGVTSGYNADVLLLATFNPDTLRATLTSIPRDTYIKTACSGKEYRRINTTTWGSSSSCHQPRSPEYEREQAHLLHPSRQSSLILSIKLSTR